MSITMTAPNLQPFFNVSARGANSYVADGNGFIANVAVGDIRDLESAGCGVRTVHIGPAKFGNLMTRKSFASQGSQNGGAGYTVSTAWALEAPFTFVRLVLYNHTASAATYAKVFGGPSAQINDYVNAKDASGNLLAPAQFTFNTGGQGLPPSASGSTTSVTIPAATSGAGTAAVVPGSAYSDWMLVRSLPRTDGGALPLFFTRIYDASQALLTCGDSGLNGSQGFDPVDAGRICRSWYASGDVTVSTAMSTATRQAQAPHMALQYIADAGGLAVLGCGDSITDGFYSTGYANSFGHQACSALSTQGFPVSWTNASQPGQGTPQIHINAMNRMAEHTPDVIILPAYSPNDDHPATQATVDASWGYAMAVVAYAIQRNIVPILWTGLPGSSITTLAQDAYRIGLNNRLRAAAVNSGGRFLMADFDAALTDGGLAANGGICRLQAQYVTTDATLVHPNDQGHAVMAGLLTPILQKIMAVRPS